VNTIAARATADSKAIVSLVMFLCYCIIIYLILL